METMEKRETYQEMRERHQKEVNEFPIGFAFSDKQFVEQMEKWGLPPVTSAVIGIGAGGFIRKTDKDAFIEMMARHRREENEAIKRDQEYLCEMFLHEMYNHEYGYTHDPEDTLDACGYSWSQIQKSKKLREAWKKAEAKCFGNDPFDAGEEEAN